jgi:hypothetical protein
MSPPLINPAAPSMSIPLAARFALLLQLLGRKSLRETGPYPNGWKREASLRAPRSRRDNVPI